MKRGPKPQRGESATIHIAIRVTDGERRDLRQVARANHASVAQVIRDAVNDYVADYRERQPVFSEHFQTKATP